LIKNRNSINTVTVNQLTKRRKRINSTQIKSNQLNNNVELQFRRLRREV
jgi:FAD synthase